MPLFCESLAFVVRSHFCNSSPVSWELRLASVMPPSFSIPLSLSLSLLHLFLPSSLRLVLLLRDVALAEALALTLMLTRWVCTPTSVHLLAAAGSDHSNSFGAFVSLPPPIQECKKHRRAVKLKRMILGGAPSCFPLTCKNIKYKTINIHLK